MSPTLPAFTSPSVNIPLLAIDAANELDEIAHGRLSHSESAHRLADLLVGSFSGAGGSEPLEIKSGTVAVFCHAIESLQGVPKVTTYEELIARALEYAGDLNAAESPSNTARLESMKNFCLALSRASASYRRPVQDKQSRNWR
jgi:hypothetical protein